MPIAARPQDHCQDLDDAQDIDSQVSSKIPLFLQEPVAKADAQRFPNGTIPGPVVLGFKEY